MTARSKIGRLRCAVEASFGADGTGTMANFFNVRHTSPAGDVSPDVVMLPDERVRSWRTQKPLEVPGLKNTEFTVSSHLVGTNQTQDASTAPTKDSTTKGKGI